MFDSFEQESYDPWAQASSKAGEIQTPREIGEAIFDSYLRAEVDGIFVAGHFHLTDGDGRSVPIFAPEIIRTEAIPLKPLPNPKMSWWISPE